MIIQGYRQFKKISIVKKVLAGISIITLFAVGTFVLSALLLCLLFFFLLASLIYISINLCFHSVPQQSLIGLAEKLGEHFLFLFSLYMKIVLETALRF